MPAAAAIACLIVMQTQLSAQQKMIRWQPVRGAGSYIFEMRDSSESIISRVETKNTYYDISSLKPGKYSYRITAMNKLRQQGRPSTWAVISVEREMVPAITSISVKKISHSYDDLLINVTGSNFLEDTQLFLVSGGKKLPLKAEYISEKSLKFRFKPGPEESGIHDLHVVNRGGFETSMPAAIEVTAPDIPVITSLSAAEVNPSVESAVLLKGENLGGGISIEVKNESGRELPVKIEPVSETAIRLIINAAAEDAGSWNISAVKEKHFRSAGHLSLTVLKPENPEIDRIHPSGTVISKGKFLIHAEGRNLDESMVFQLQGGGRVFTPVKVQVNKRSAYIFFEEDHYPAGEYSLYCEKKLYPPLTIQKAVTIKDPSQGLLGLKGLHAAAGWEYHLPYGDWREKLNGTPTAFQLYLSYPFSSFNLTRNIPVLNMCEAETTAGYYSYSIKDGSADESISSVTWYTGLNMPLPLDFLIYNLYFVPRLNLGAIYTSADLKNSGSINEFTSLDPAVMGGASMRYVWFNLYFTDISADFSRVFYIGRPLDSAVFSVRLGIIL